MSDIQNPGTAFIRREMLPAKPPPVNTSGAIRWLQEKLFSGPVNTILTLLGLAIIWLIVSHFWDWFAHSVWNAGSLAECRQIIAETWGDGARGACFAVIHERWPQFIFGFYPPELYWRPTMAFGLLFLALTPVLFSESAFLRRMALGIATVVTLVSLILLSAPIVWLAFAAVMLIGGLAISERDTSPLLFFTLGYPLLAVWLVWGGSAWGPLMVPLGVVLGWAAWMVVNRFSTLFAPILGIVVTLIFWIFFANDVSGFLRGIISLSIQPVESSNFGGFLLAITIGLAGIALSLPLGIILAMSRRSDMFLVKSLSVMFIEFIRGVPLITLLFVAQLLLNYFLPPGTNFDLILRVIIMVTLFSAAYMAEAVRGGLAALPRGQFEAADALGLDYWKAQRLIILPQALKISIPGIVSSFISLFKDTTLVAFVGLYEPLKNIPDSIRANFEWKGTYWEHFIFVGVIFFIICFGMSRYSMYLERRLERDHK